MVGEWYFSLESVFLDHTHQVTQFLREYSLLRAAIDVGERRRMEE